MVHFTNVPELLTNLIYNNAMLTKTIVVFIVCAIAIGLVGNGYAHKAEVIGDYKVEVGWKNEPPIAGQKNSIEIVVTVATDFDKESHESEEHKGEHMEHEEEMEHDESIEHEGMTHEEHEEEMKMEGDMTNGKTAKQLHDEAVKLESQGKYAEAAELHHEAGNKLHDEAVALESEGKYTEAAEHHHQAGNHHHMAAVDLEKISEFAEAAEHHEMAAEHHEMAAVDLEKVGQYAEAQEHRDESAEHKELAELDREKSTEPHEAMKMEHEEHLEPGEAVSGLSEQLEVTISLQGKKTSLVLTESSKAGIYHADYTPAEVGFPSVNLVGEIGHQEFEITFHPEKVEEISILSPLKQIQFNIIPSEVECKSEMVLLIKNSNGNPACVNPSSADKLESLGWGTRA